MACAILSLGLAASSAQVYSVAPSNAAPRYVAEPGNDLGYYLNGDLGLSIMPDFQSPRFGFPGEFHLDDGVYFGLEPDYNFWTVGRLTLGGEFETGITYDRFSSGSSIKMFPKTDGSAAPNRVPGTISDATTALFWPSNLASVKLIWLGLCQSVLTT